MFDRITYLVLAAMSARDAVSHDVLPELALHVCDHKHLSTPADIDDRHVEMSDASRFGVQSWSNI